MTGFNFNFNAREHDPTVGFDPVPSGKYPVIIKTSNVNPLKPPKQGGLLQLQYEVIDGPGKGRTIYDRLNLWNESDQSREIANKQLSAICHVLGVYDVQGGAAKDNAVPQLHNQPFVIDVVYVPADDKGNRAGNNVVGYFTMQGQAPARQGTAGPGAPAGFPTPQPTPQPQPGFAPQPGAFPPQPQPGPQPGAAGPAWGGQAAGPAAPQPGGGQPAWGGGAPQPAGPGPAAPQPAWGGQPAAGPGPAAPQPAAPAWGGAPAGGGAPWGAR